MSQKLSQKDLEALREKVEGPSWCIECQEKVETNEFKECPVCGDETVPIIGHDFLKRIYEVVKDAG